MKSIPISVGDILQMKKKHPCGCAEMRVLRIGSDIRIQCAGCGHDVTVPRVKLEKNIKKVIPGDITDPTKEKDAQHGISD